MDVGQKVKAGQVLATIDLSNSAYGVSFNNAQTTLNNSVNSFNYTEESIKNDLEAARIQLENAKANKENTYATTEKQLNLTKTQLDNISKTKKNTYSTTEESFKSADLLAKNAQTSIDNFEKNSESSLASLYSSLGVSITSGLTTIDNSLTQIDTILGVSDKNKTLNDSYETYLGAKEITTKTEAENAYGKTKEEYLKIVGLSAKTRDELDVKLDKTTTIVDLQRDLLEKIVTMLNNSIAAASFPQSQLDTISANITKIQATNLQLQSQFSTLKNSIVQTKTQIDTQRVSLQNALSIAQTQLANIKAGNISQIDAVNGNEILTQNQLDSTYATIKASQDSVDNALKIAQANYDSVQAKLNSQRVQAKSAIDSAKGGKDIAGINLGNTSIVAPFDGIITAKNIEIGTMIAAGSPAFTIGDNSKMKVKLDVNSDNITYLKITQEAQISRNGKSFTGIISLLSPTTDPTTKMFKAEILFSGTPDGINLGDYVDVTIHKVNGTESMLLVPFSSIVSLGQGEYSLFVVTDGVAKARSVKVGAQNSSQVQILSGLKE